VTPLIDMHCHVVPDGFPRGHERCSARWPCLRHEGNDQATLLIGDKPFRALDNRSWDVTRRIADMDRDAVSMQVLSPMPELLSYWFSLDDALAMGDHVNGAIAAMVAARPDRFQGLGMVPLQDPDRAVRTLERLRSTFGLRGAEIGSNICGAYLGDPKFRPFFAAAEELGMAIFVHALHPLAAEPLGNRADLIAFAGFPADTALSAATLIAAGLFDDFPRLRIGLSHGGGALGPIIHRMEYGVAASNRPAPEKLTPAQHGARFYYDSLVYDRAYLRHLAEEVAPGQVFLGTDYPYLIAQTDPAAFLQTSGVWSPSLAHHAAERFLGL
jgi:aminocarboxymuconate-semialdehyde decarboxylase